MTASAQKTPEIADRKDRDLARITLDRNVIVEAGAGTGKTTLLTDRAVFLLLGAGMPITEIVALTFTEKAAGEIRLRLGERLLELLEYWRGSSALEGKARAKCASLTEELKTHFRISAEAAAARARVAVEDMDKAMIGTLHGFASRLLRAYPLQAGVDPSFQIDSDGELIGDLFASEWALWLDAELGESSPREREWIEILGSATLDGLEDLAKGLCGPRVDFDGVLNDPAGMRAWLRETIALLESEPLRQPPAKGKIVQRLKVAAARLKAIEARSKDSPLEEIPSASWPSGWSTENKERCERAANIAETIDLDGEEFLKRAASLLLPFCRSFRATVTRRGLISFDGLLIAARDLVRDHPEVREELKSKYRAFLVDEFQDTDPLQGELLFFLAERKGGRAHDWKEAVLEAGRLFVVGDPKQSIYRFRGADLAAYEEFLRHMTEREPRAISCALTANFRSNSKIIGPVNGVFSDLMRYAQGSQPAYRAIECGVEVAADGAGVEAVAVEMEDKNAGGVEAVRRAEGEWIADWIEAHRGRPYALKHISILLRTATPLGAYLEVLKERGIPYVVEAEKYFYGTQEVLDFLNLLRALDDPSDRVALAGLLRSPLVGLADADLVRLSFAGELDYRKTPRTHADGVERVRRFYEALRRTRDSVGRVPLAELAAAIESEFQVVELLSAAYHGQQTVSNLVKLMRLAATASDARGLTLKGFIERVRRDISEAKEEGESPLADEHLDAVRILTIHKSKGLEYPVVILPNMSGLSRGDVEHPPLRLDWSGSGAGLHLSGVATSLAAFYLQQKERGRERDEAVRLLYVAMTRAKERMILVGAAEGASGSFASRLSELPAWPSMDGATARAFRVEAASTARRARKEAAVASGLSGLDRIAERWKARDSRRKELESLSRHLSPSAAEIPPSAPVRRRVEKSETPAVVPPNASLIGQLCHRVLQQWDFGEGGDLEEALRRAKGALAFGREQEDWAGIEAEARDILRGFLLSEAARDLARAEILGREIPFVHGIDGAVMRGTIDILFRMDGALWVADYKTDRVEKKEAKKAAQRYAPQAKAYQEAVCRFLDEKRVGCRLIFLRSGAAVDIE